jgi:hypothetical protein
MARRGAAVGPPPGEDRRLRHRPLLPPRSFPVEAATFRNQERITSIYRDEGVIHALVHTE